MKSRRWSQTFVDWRFGSAPWMFWTSRDPSSRGVSDRTVDSGGRAAEAAVVAHRAGAQASDAARRCGSSTSRTTSARCRRPGAPQRATAHGWALTLRISLRPDGAGRSHAPRVRARRAALPAGLRLRHGVVAADCRRVPRRSAGIPTPRCVLNVFPKTQRPAAPRPRPPSLPLTLYWFSQTIGPGPRARRRRARDGPDAGRRNGPARPRVLVPLTTSGSSPRGRGMRRGRRAHRGHPLAAPDEMVRRSATYDIGLALEVGGTRNSDLALGNKLFTYLLGGQAILATRTTAQRWLLDHIGEAAPGYRPARRRHARRAPSSLDRASGRARRRQARVVGVRRSPIQLGGRASGVPRRRPHRARRGRRGGVIASLADAAAPARGQGRREARPHRLAALSAGERRGHAPRASEPPALRVVRMEAVRAVGRGRLPGHAAGAAPARDAAGRSRRRVHERASGAMDPSLRRSAASASARSHTSIARARGSSRASRSISSFFRRRCFPSWRWDGCGSAASACRTCSTSRTPG